MDFGIRYNDNSIMRRKEFGTVFFSFNENGSTFYSYLIPVIGDEGGVILPHLAPLGTTLEGEGHTHGYGFDYETFSTTDLSAYRYAFLCTPTGSLYQYDARNYSYGVITRDLPNMSNFMYYNWSEPDHGYSTSWKRILMQLFGNNF